MLYRPSSSPLEWVRALFRKRVGDGKLAYLGESLARGARVEVPGRTGYVYVCFPDGKDANGYQLVSDPTIARSTGVPYLNYPGAMVYVAVKYNNELEIVSAHYAGLDQANIDTRVLNPLNQQSKWVYPWQWTVGLALAVATAASESTLIMIKSVRYFVGNVFQVKDTPEQSDKIDLASYIPAADEQVYAGLWLDTYTNTIEVTTSVVQGIDEPLDQTDIQELATDRPPDAMPLKAFRLSNAQATITQSADEVDLRQHLDTPHLWGFPNALTTRERVWPNRTLVAGPYTTSGVGSVAIESGAQVLIVHKSNVAAVAPDVTDDSDSDYSIGSRWLDSVTGFLYVATDVTPGAAVWAQISSGGAGMTSFDVGADVGLDATITNGDLLEIVGSGGITTSIVGSTVTVDGSTISVGVISVGATAPISSSGGATPVITHDNSTVTPGTYTRATVTFDARGHATSAANGVPVVTSVSASSPIVSSGGTTPNISHAASGVSAGTYTNPSSITMNASGHITTITGGPALKSVIAQIDVYTTPGSTVYNPPGGVFEVEVVCVGGGSGGGSGRRGGGFGGSGGAAGGFTRKRYVASMIAGAQTIVVGAGGAGGAARTTDNTSGVNGVQGGDTFFGGTTAANAIQMAVGSVGNAQGKGGTAVGGTLGGVGVVVLGASLYVYGSSGGGVNSTTGIGEGGTIPAEGPGGGGGGGSAFAVSVVGGDGARANGAAFPPSGTGGGAASVLGAVGANGTAGIINGTSAYISGGGGAGGSPLVGVGRAGGNGGLPGGGGGGGSSSLNGNNSGAGGNGGDGMVMIISYLYA